MCCGRRLRGVRLFQPSVGVGLRLQLPAQLPAAPPLPKLLLPLLRGAAAVALLAILACCSVLAVRLCAQPLLPPPPPPTAGLPEAQRRRRQQQRQQQRQPARLAEQVKRFSRLRCMLPVLLSCAGVLHARRRRRTAASGLVLHTRCTAVRALRRSATASGLLAAARLATNPSLSFALRVQSTSSLCVSIPRL